MGKTKKPRNTLLYKAIFCYFLHNFVKVKGCVRCICSSLFLCLKENTNETRKNIFYFTSKAVFILERIKF